MMFDPDWCIAPGATLAEVLVEHHFSTHVAARILDMTESDVDEILIGAKRITPSIARRLQAAFGISADLWLALECDYRDGLKAGKTDVTNESRTERTTRRVRRPWSRRSE